ncbi:hypothetical protein PanWU01x14_313410, partial [Parasponia andersonii]
VITLLHMYIAVIIITGFQQLLMQQLLSRPFRGLPFVVDHEPLHLDISAVLYLDRKSAPVFASCSDVSAALSSDVSEVTCSDVSAVHCPDVSAAPSSDASAVTCPDASAGPCSDYSAVPCSGYRYLEAARKADAVITKGSSLLIKIPSIQRWQVLEFVTRILFAVGSKTSRQVETEGETSNASTSSRGPDKGKVEVLEMTTKIQKMAEDTQLDFPFTWGLRVAHGENLSSFNVLMSKVQNDLKPDQVVPD